MDKNYPAFPVPNLEHDESFNGMTLRDYFAAKALPALISMTHDELQELTGNYDEATTNSLIAEGAYGIAYSMMKAREA